MIEWSISRKGQKMPDMTTIHQHYRTMYSPVCMPYEWVTVSGSHYDYYPNSGFLYRHNTGETPLMSEVTEFYFPVFATYRPFIVGRNFSTGKRSLLLTTEIIEWTSSEWARHQDLGVSWSRPDGTSFFRDELWMMD